MSQEECKELLPLLESLKKLSSEIVIGGKELKDRIILGFEEELKRHFFFIRLLLSREFNSGTGMDFDKWAEFADTLAKRFESIFNATQSVCDNCYEAKSCKIPENLAQLEQATNRYLEDYDDTIESLNRLQKWLTGAPEAAKSAPAGVFSEEEKRTLVESALKGAADLKKLIEALDEAKRKILTIKTARRQRSERAM